MLTRFGPPLAIVLLAGPILLGIAGTLLPAFGYLPALGGETFTFEHFGRLLAEPGIGISVMLSFGAGIAATAISLTVVMFFVAGWAGTKSFQRIVHLISPLLSIPHAAAAFGLAFLIAPSGMIARALSPWLTGWSQPPDMQVVNDPLALSMIAGLVVKEIPFLLLVTLAALPQSDARRMHALTTSLGYGAIAGFLHGPWRLIYRQIRLAVFAVIAFSSSVVDVATILGPTTPAPLAVRLVGWMGDPDLSMRFFASAGALLQLAVTAATLAVWIALERIGAVLRDRIAVSGRRFRRDFWLRRAAFAAMTLSAAVIFAGLATMCLWSLAGLWQFPDALPRRFGIETWVKTLPRALDPLATTLLVATLSTALAVMLGLLFLASEDETGGQPRRWPVLLVYLPLIVPQVAFLFGLQLLFLLTGTDASLGALVCAHLVFVAPYVFLSLSDPWRAHDRRYDAIAAGLGKSRRTTMLRIRLPMLARAVLTAAAVGFAVSVGLYLPTVLIGAGRLETITTEAVALASGGNRRVIGVYTFLQMLLPAAGFLVATVLPALVFRHRRGMRV